MRRGRGGMSAAALNGILNVEHTLLADTDESNGLLYAGEYVFYNCSALVNYETGSDASLLKEVNDSGRAAAVNFLVAGEGEINIVFGNEALGNKSLCRLKGTVKSSLCIEGAASPENALINNALECGLLPVLFNYRNYVEVRHKNCGSIGSLTLPMKKDRTVGRIFSLAFCKNAREKLGEERLEAVEFRLVLIRSVTIGDSLALDHLGKVVGSLLAINEYGLYLLSENGSGLKAKSTDKKDSYAYKKEKEKTAEYS
jgi:hypothetical protein